MNQILERKQIENNLASLASVLVAGMVANKDNFRTILSSEFKTTMRLRHGNSNPDNELTERLSSEVKDNIQNLIEKISAYLTKQNIDFKIVQTVKSDPEYPDFNRVKIGIRIAKDLDFIYRILKNPIYEIINKSVSPEFEDKILIKLEKL